MADDDTSINSSSLDNRIDGKIAEQPVRDERYKNNVADKHVSLGKTGDVAGKSWAMSEIERAVGDEILGGKPRKLASFGMGLQRKNDFRLKDLTRRLESQIRSDFAKDITTGPITARTKDIDIQSQSMRMITANAALGSYQFQKSQTLPYMRKSLSLDYEKVDLLRKIVGGIGSLEKAVVNKLEAIKMNTAASVPKKLSYFGSIMKEVKEQNVKRIAGNISNLIMDRYDEKYKKYISPVFARLNQIMHDPSGKGGVNGAIGAVTQKLNNIRHTAMKAASTDNGTLTTIGRIQNKAASVASSILGGTVKFGQSHKLSPGMNTFASNRLKDYTSFADRLHPFAPLNLARPSENTPTNDLNNKIGFTPIAQSSPFDRLFKLVSNWRHETQKTQAHLLDHVRAIREKIAPDTLTILPSTKAFKAKPFTLPINKVAPSALKTKITIPPVSIKPVSSVKPVTVRSSVSFDHPLPTKRRSLPKLSVKPIVTTVKALGLKVPKLRLTPRQKPVASVIKPLHLVQEHHIPTLHKDTKPVVDPIKTMIGTFTNQLSKLGASLKGDSKARGLYEKAQTKKQQVLDKLAARAKTRKGSYEDLEEMRKKGRGFLPWGAAAAGAGVKETMGQGGAGLDGSKGGSAIPSITELAGGALGFVGKKTLKYGWKGTKAVSKLGFRAARKAIPFAAKTGGRGLIGLTKFAGREAAGATRLAGRGGMGLLKLGGRGGFSLLKSGGGLLKGGLGIGLAAGIGKHYFDKSGVTGGKKRAGDTALDMLQYGAMGAEVGAMFGGIGAVPGAAIGAAAGAIIANSDYVAKSLREFGSGANAAGMGLLGSIFGSHFVKRDGTIYDPNKTSLMDTLNTAFFGHRGRLDDNGKLVDPKNISIISDVKYGFQKLLFGDKKPDDTYKPGTSLLSELKDGIMKLVTLDDPLNKNKSGDPTKPSSDAVNRLNPNMPGRGSSDVTANTDFGNTGGGANDNTPQPAARINAKGVKGGVRDQPEYKAAYQKLPANIKKMVDGSKSLQFVLWSTAVQHGADSAGKIFQKDYSEKLDEKGYMRSIYQDRSTRFANLGGDDRTSAVTHLGEEQRFAEGIQSGSTTPTMTEARKQVSNLVDPSGNSNSGFDSSMKPASVTGSTASRAKDAVQYLMSKRFSKTAALAVVGNLLEESSLRTNLPGDNGSAYGLAQWHKGRRDAIAKQFGKPVQNMNFHEQLDAVEWEMRTGAKGAVTGGINLVDRLNKQTDLGRAVGDVVNMYERPAERRQNTINRTKLAMGVEKSLGTDTGSGASKATTAPAAKPAASTPTTSAPRAAGQRAAPAPKGGTPGPHPLAGGLASHGSDVRANTQALRDHAAAMGKMGGTPTPPANQNNIVVSPIVQAAHAVEGFLSMSMKKTQVAVGGTD